MLKQISTKLQTFQSVYSFGEDKKIVFNLQEILKKKVSLFGTQWLVKSIETIGSQEITIKKLGLSSLFCVEEKSTSEIYEYVFQLVNMTRRHYKLSKLTFGILRKVIDSLVAKDRLQDANRLFMTLASIHIFDLVDENLLKHSQAILEVLIKSNLKSGNIPMAICALESISQYLKKPQDIFFNKILDYLSKNQIKGKFSESLLSIMIKNNIKASLVTFNTLLDLYITQNNYTMANHLFKSLNQKMEPCPDNFTFSIMMNGVKTMPNAEIATALSYYR